MVYEYAIALDLHQNVVNIRGLIFTKHFEMRPCWGSLKTFKTEITYATSHLF